MDAAIEPDTDVDTEEVLLWRTGPEWFGMPLPAVVEVTPVAAITRKAGRGTGDLLGWVGLRGESVPVLDVDRVLGTPSSPVAASDRFVVLLVAGRRLAVRVHEVAAIVRVEVPAADWSAPFRPARVVENGVERLVQVVDPSLAFPLKGVPRHA